MQIGKVEGRGIGRVGPQVQVRAVLQDEIGRRREPGDVDGTVRTGNVQHRRNGCLRNVDWAGIEAEECGGCYQLPAIGGTGNGVPVFTGHVVGLPGVAGIGRGEDFARRIARHGGETRAVGGRRDGLPIIHGRGWRPGRAGIGRYVNLGTEAGRSHLCPIGGTGHAVAIKAKGVGHPCRSAIGRGVYLETGISSANSQGVAIGGRGGAKPANVGGDGDGPGLAGIGRHINRAAERGRNDFGSVCGTGDGSPITDKGGVVAPAPAGVSRDMNGAVRFAGKEFGAVRRRRDTRPVSAHKVRRRPCGAGIGGKIDRSAAVSAAAGRNQLGPIRGTGDRCVGIAGGGGLSPGLRSK